MRKHWTVVLKEKKGAFSILWVLLIFVAAIAATGLLNLIELTYVINETQSIMDITGESQLQTGVNDYILRSEVFQYNQQTMINNYNASLSNQIHDNGLISNFQVLNTNIYQQTTTFGLGTYQYPRPQVVLDSTVGMNVSVNPIFRIAPFVEKTFFSSFNNSDFTVSMQGNTSAGQAALVIRSVTRIVYR